VENLITDKTGKSFPRKSRISPMVENQRHQLRGDITSL